MAVDYIAEDEGLDRVTRPDLLRCGGEGKFIGVPDLVALLAYDLVVPKLPRYRPRLGDARRRNHHAKRN